MEAPRIQFAKTADGVNIGFCEAGDGPALVFTPFVPWSHFAEMRQFASYRQSRETLAYSGQRVVEFDGRGTGSSDLSRIDFTLDAQMLDLEAVLDRLSLDRFGLLGIGPGTRLAVSYADHHPERVSNLVLVQPVAGPSVYQISPQNIGLESLRNMADERWELYVLALVNLFLGFADSEQARRIADVWRRTTTPRAVQAWADWLRSSDLTDAYARLKVRTLVLLSAGQQADFAARVREAAALIPAAQLVVTKPDPSWVPGALIREEVEAIVAFLGGATRRPSFRAPGTIPEGAVVILFTDIVESTALTERLGDAAFRARARELDASLRTLVRENSGTPVEGTLLGDGLLAVFTSARQAIDCALRCNGAAEEAALQLHLGLHAGDVLREGNNVYGGAVNIAARIKDASAPGQVLVSDTVRALARTSAGVTFADQGEHTLKGIADPVRVYEVRGQA